MDNNDPILLTTKIGGMTFLLSFTILCIVKPDFVTKIEDDDHIRDYSKIINVSFLFTFLVMIIAFLQLTTNRIVEYNDNILNKENGTSY
jgi:hypothetical protein